jgi:hypothetical protein
MKRFAWLAGCAVLSAWGLGSAIGGCGADEETPVTTGGDGGASSSGGSSSGGSSSGGSSSGGTGDAGIDGSSSSGGASNPGKISCGATECSEAGVVCCLEIAGGGADAGITRTCQDEGDCNGARLECDEARDCPDFDAGDRCCGEITNSGALRSRCRDDCGNNDPQLCKTNDECGDGGACAEFTCPIVGKVRACAKPNGCN